MQRRFYSSSHSLVSLSIACIILTCLGILGLYQGDAQANSASFQTVRDCNDGAIINCGALTTGQLISQYDSNQYAQKVYANLNITAASIKNLLQNAKVGYVTNNGSVYITTQTAPLTQTTFVAERQKLAGSKSIQAKGAHFYEVSASEVISGKSTDAFVVTTNHQFDYAIIASNGDPVVMTPSTKTAQPTTTLPATQSKTTTLTSTGPTTNTTIALFSLSFLTAITFAYRHQLKHSNNQ